VAEDFLQFLDTIDKQSTIEAIFEIETLGILMQLRELSLSNGDDQSVLIMTVRLN
jgi:hypothetical protein